MATIHLFSTSTISNPNALPVRRADTGPTSADIVAWYTTVEVDPDTLSPLAAWLAEHVRSTLLCGTTVRLTSSELNSEIMRREGKREDAIARYVRAFGDDPVTLDWRFSQFDPRAVTPEQWLEREARRIMALRPRRIAVVQVGRPRGEFDMALVAA